MAFQGDSIYWVEVEKVVANPFQPRREFDESKLKELADSIRMYGVLQPLTVTRKEIQREDGTFYTEYELIAGERRLRASKLAGVAQVPVIIREGEQSEQEKLELAIIENLQREDLNAVDRALAFRQLADSFGLSHSQVAEKVGRSREYVSNTIRLLALPEYILDALRHGNISEGHARTLLMLSDKPEEQEVIFKEITLKKLSVRESERIIRKIAADRVRKKNPDEFDTELLEYEKQFTETLGTRVQIQKTEFGGKLTIDYFSVEDLETMLERMRDAEAPAVAQASVHEAINALREHTPLEPDNTSVPVTPSPADTVAPSAAATQDSAPQPASEQREQSVTTNETAESPMAEEPKIDHPTESSHAPTIVPGPDQTTPSAPVNHQSVPESGERTSRQTATPPPPTASAFTPTPVPELPRNSHAPAGELVEKKSDEVTTLTTSAAAPAQTTENFSQTEATATPAAPHNPAEDEVHPELHSTEASSETPTAPARRQDDDDAGLYSIRNFSI